MVMKDKKNISEEILNSLSLKLKNKLDIGKTEMIERKIRKN